MQTRWLYIFICLVVATSSHGDNFSNPTLNELSEKIDRSQHLDKNYYPPWLASSDNVSGYELGIKKSLLWLLSPSARVDFVRNDLPNSGINTNDPVLFNKQELDALNLYFPHLPKRSPFETTQLADASQSIELFNGNSSGVDYLHSLFAIGTLKPSQLVYDTYAWYDQNLADHLKDVLIKTEPRLAFDAAFESDQRWQKCREEYGGQIALCKQKGVVKPLDGIPMVVKDELNVLGYTTSGGLNPRSITDHEFPPIAIGQESSVVTLMKDAGMIVLGKSNQHIFGLGGTGENPHYPKIANIFSPYHVPGGSSSGTALAVALNLSPLSIGTDGGGSVSIPASANGLPGLKPTLNKLSTDNYDDAAPGLVSVGLIGKNFKDIATGYSVSSATNPTAAVSDTLADLAIGIDPDWFEHADPQIAQQTMVCLDRLSAKLNHNPLVMMQFMPKTFRHQLWASHIILFGKGEADGKASFIDRGVPDETAIALTMGLALTDEQVKNAKENQIRLKTHFDNNLFTKVDVLAMPTTLTSAPAKASNWLPQYVDRGELNLSKAYLLAFNTAVANLTENPRITIPCGFDSDNLPIGLQLMGADHSEYLLMALGHLLEQEMAEELNNASAMQAHHATFEPNVNSH